MSFELTPEERLREAAHRIKNHLQMVASVLALQSRQSANPELREELDEAAHRIMAVALLHEQLQRKGDSPVDMAAYLQGICRELALGSNCEDRGVRISLEIEPVDLPSDQAVTLGLITSELVTNALKYAYAGGPGVVAVAFEHDGPDWRLTVADHGRGLTTSPSEARGFGLRLIGRLAQRLGGAFTVVSDGFGAQFSVDFPFLPERASGGAIGPAAGGRATLHLT